MEITNGVNPILYHHATIMKLAHISHVPHLDLLLIVLTNAILHTQLLIKLIYTSERVLITFLVELKQFKLKL